MRKFCQKKLPTTQALDVREWDAEAVRIAAVTKVAAAAVPFNQFVRSLPTPF